MSSQLQRGVLNLSGGTIAVLFSFEDREWLRPDDIDRVLKKREIKRASHEIFFDTMVLARLRLIESAQQGSLTYRLTPEGRFVIARIRHVTEKKPTAEVRSHGFSEEI